MVIINVRPARNLALCLMFLIAALGVLHAQYDNGSLVGTIHDATGAVVPSVSVTIRNNDTGVASLVTTSGTGDYEVATLRPGVYSISAEAPGFAKTIARNITISVGGRLRIDLVLTAGAANTEVQVVDVALQMETESSQRDEVVTQYQTAALPLVSRNYSDLLGLVSGVRQAPTAATTTSISSIVRAGAYNVNGQRSIFNNFILDGMDNNAYGESNQGFDNQIIAIPPDSVAQFSVVTNNESAEYGRSSGATINTASRGGTNQFHGLLYEFIRNTDLNAAGYFKPTVGAFTFKKPTFNRNQYGINFGGPIIHGQLFFFLDYEGFRQVLRPLTVYTLPTQNELNGNLAVAVRNPVTGSIYQAHTAIPDINPISQQIVNAFKTIPGLPLSGASTGVASNDYAIQAPFTDNADKGDLRFDYTQSASSSWFLRVSDRKEHGVNNPTIIEPLDGQQNGNTYILDQQIALGHTHLFGADKVLDARLGLSRTKAGKYTLSLGNNAITVPGLPSGYLSGGLPAVGITGGFTPFGRQTTNPQWQNPALIDPKVNFTWVRRKHSLKFGYEYEHVWMAVNDNNPFYGSWTFGKGYATCPTQTVGGVTSPLYPNCTDTTTVADDYWADFLFGNTSGYAVSNYFVVHLRQTLQSAYAQDDWKVSPKLTLNLGLRWEYGSPYSEQNNNISNFDPVSQTVLTLTAGASGTGLTPVPVSSGVYGHTLISPDLNDFGPRIGFAYAMLSHTTLRGGYGVSYVHYTRAGSGNILAINAPQAQFTNVSPQVTPTTSNHCTSAATASTSCYVTIDQGFPNGIATNFNPKTDNITWVPKDTRDSYVQNYYLGIQQQLRKNTLLDIAYVGNHGVKLQGFLNGNQLVAASDFTTRQFSNWPSDITEALNEFKSSYHSLQVRYEQRMEGGLTLLNSFTWEHSLDNASASLEGNSPSPQDGKNIRSDYSQSDYNLPIANITSLVYELPIGRGTKFLSNVSRPVNALLGGWQVSVINTMQSGTPFNLTYTPNAANIFSPQIAATYRGLNEYRPYRVPGVPLTQGRSSRSAGSGYVNYINYAALVLPPTRDTAPTPNLLSPNGTSSRNPGRTPAFYQTDLALNKKFNTPLRGLKGEFRTEFYNIFNHTNLFLPGSGLSGTPGTLPANTNLGAGASAPLSSITGGHPTSGGVISSTFEPRIIQFGLKLLF
ncbi:MAG TPA: TonB-dependent receptor [Acidobacteriaceae bacterium]